MRHPIQTTLLVTAIAVLLTGCSWSQVFRLSVSVVDKADGKPISGVKVDVDESSNNEDRKNEQVETGRQTDENGRLDYDFSISGYTPTASGGERWYLKLRKDGYEPVVLDFKPKPPPERNNDGPIHLTVRVEMQPVANPPR